MRRYIVDASAWIDYFRGTPRGKSVKQLILPPGKAVEIITPTITLAELKKHYVKENLEGFDQDMENVRLLSNRIPDLDWRTAIRAGELHAHRKNRDIGIVDCILLAVAEMDRGKVLSLDGHFKRRPEAMYIGGKQELS